MDPRFSPGKSVLKKSLFTTSEVNHSSASEVMEPLHAEPALLVPGPVGRDRVDEAGDHEAVDDVRTEVAPLCQGTW